jgi:transposase InsO family protein
VDHVFIERFWHTLKHEHVLVHAYESVKEARESIGQFICLYNEEHLHQSRLQNACVCILHKQREKGQGR